MLGADSSYDAANFVEQLRTLNAPPHVAQNVSRRRSAVDRRPTRHPGYAASLRARIEEAFGWIKTVAGLRRTKFRGLEKVDWSSTFAATAYNLFRLPKLLGAIRLQSQQPFMVSTALASWFWVDSDPTSAIDATLSWPC